MTAEAIFTIGHSTQPWPALRKLLQRWRVTAVADVRSVPASRHTPQFNRDILSRSLSASGIKYVFLGDHLGARTDDLSCYVAGKVQYQRLAQTPALGWASGGCLRARAPSASR